MPHMIRLCFLNRLPHKSKILSTRYPMDINRISTAVKTRIDSFSK